MSKAEKIWSNDAGKMGAFLLRELKDTGAEWKKLLSDCLEDYKRGTILDVGCGTGFISLLLAQIGCEVIAIDNNAAMLEEAKKISKELDNSNKITFILKDAESTNFTDNTFDAVVSRHTSWLFHKPEKVYEEWYRVLKSGGCMLNLDANWLFPFWGDEEEKLFRSDEALLIKRYGSFRDYYHDTDMMNELKKLPLSYIKRPEWDFKIFKEIGFKDVEIEILNQEKYWNPFMLLRYRTMPTFLVKAKK